MMIWFEPSELLEKRAAIPELPFFRKFKYLSYLPCPIQLLPSQYDLVEDEAFCYKDDRLPLLILTQYGIFPPATSYPLNCRRNYPALQGLEGQWMGFIKRAYLSNREKAGIWLMPPNRTQ
jgi:hypothetical protein